MGTWSDTPILQQPNVSDDKFVWTPEITDEAGSDCSDCSDDIEVVHGHIHINNNNNILHNPMQGSIGDLIGMLIGGMNI